MVSSIPCAIVEEIEAHTRSTVRSFSFSSGGCINHGGKLTTSTGLYFLKWNDLKKFPGMFAVEARGLSLLRGANALAVPELIHAGHPGVFQFLLLEYLEEGRRVKELLGAFRIGLAALHKSSADEFGLDHDNYIGSLPRKNNRSSSWVDFFREQRLKVQLKMAHDKKRIDSRVLKKFDTLYNKLSSLFPEEPPALLHGDLWGGNMH